MYVKKEKKFMQSLETAKCSTLEPANAAKPKSKTETFSIRIDAIAKRKIEGLLKRANKKKLGRRVKANELILAALSLVNEEHLQGLRRKSLSNKDLFEIRYAEHCKKNKSTSRDEFLGLLMNQMQQKV
jgi:hypothetical protein